jgi:hypothetical protein
MPAAIHLGTSAFTAAGWERAVVIYLSPAKSPIR